VLSGRGGRRESRGWARGWGRAARRRRAARSGRWRPGSRAVRGGRRARRGWLGGVGEEAGDDEEADPPDGRIDAFDLAIQEEGRGEDGDEQHELARDD